MPKLKTIIYFILVFILGLGVGGFLFAKTQKRSFLAINNCQSLCYKTSDLAGLLVSLGIQNVPGIIPTVVEETDKTIVIKDPFPEARIHLLIVPKKDITNAGNLSQEDVAYLTDAYAVMDDIIQREGLTKYRIITNGPGYQKVTYLHFHLMAD